MGEFGRAHGLRGEVRLKSFTADPLGVAAYGPLLDETGRRWTLSDVRPAGGAPDLVLARVEGVTDRSGAEALNRLRLYVERSRLGEPESADEFLHADLVGLSVEDATGRVLGRVAGMANYGGGDILEIAPAGGGRRALLPFTRAFVPVVDIPGRRLVIEPPDDLFETDTGDAA
jgi:16S rRNA processing protein RimM